MSATSAAVRLLRELHRRTVAAGMPPPAALVGEWAGADAVIAPSVMLRPGCAPPDHPTRFWFGYLGFPVHPDDGPLPQSVGGSCDAVLLLRDGGWTYRHRDGAGPPSWIVDALRAADAPEPASSHERVWRAQWTPPQPEPHLRAIEACLAAIRAGEVYQACVCTQFSGNLTGAAVDYFADLARSTAPRKAAFLQGDWGAVASFSPETFLRRTGRVVTSSPIKGTLPITADPVDLAGSDKDVAENIMIVDLVRNDLGRVARTGSVTVPELLTVTPAPGVWHLVSTVTASVPDALGNRDLLAATFPPASVTGTPKLRACELLADWEATARGVYCGAIGFAGPGGELDLNVAIRTVSVTPQCALTLGVGGGITIDSDPAREWQECLDKASSIVELV